MAAADLRLLAGLALLLFGGLAAYLAVGEGEGAVALVLAGACLALLVLAAAFLGRKRLGALGQALYSLARTGSPGPRSPDVLAEPLSALAEALRSAWDERDLLLAALDASPDGLLVLDAEGRVRFTNAAAASFLGRDRASLAAQPLAWFLPHEAAVEALRRVRREGGTVTLAVEGPGGRALELTAAAVGIGGRVLVALRDLTETRRVDQVRRDFVANVSHELRTPLAALRSALETLRAGAMDDPQARELFLTRAEAEAERLTRLVEELLELSRLEAGVGLTASAPVDVGQVLLRAVERMEPQARRAGLDLELKLPPSLPSVLGDAERLERAVVNLLDNAIKFTPPGGSVTVMANAAEEGVLVMVQDTGIGIDERDLPRIFERFYKADRSRHQPGAGLGLAIVRHIVEAHGGRVWAQSTPGEGSTFAILLPSPASDG
ncbi:Alkaline phosphatase synthesis sensor protein PhoR [bacterium HR24]|nr:Alkaline phosphatase synthesis sensor protein PhoR [bacterium HR24]